MPRRRGKEAQEEGAVQKEAGERQEELEQTERSLDLRVWVCRAINRQTQRLVLKTVLLRIPYTY